MSDDDPATNDATKNQPHRGGARGGVCVSGVARCGPSMARRFLRAVGVSVTCTLVSACWYSERSSMAVMLFSQINLCPDDRIAVKPVPPPQPPPDLAADSQRFSLWQEKYAGASWYQLEGCGVITVYHCYRQGKCVVGMW
jgi:hypothetical protein